MSKIDALIGAIWTKAVETPRLGMLSGYHRENIPFLKLCWLGFLIVAGATAIFGYLSVFFLLAVVFVPTLLVVFAYAFTFTVKFQTRVRSTPTFGTMRENKPHLP